MIISLEIPKEFEEHFNMDRFKDSLERVCADIQCNIEHNKITMAGLYELEIIMMLKDSLIKAEVTK